MWQARAGQGRGLAKLNIGEAGSPPKEMFASELIKCVCVWCVVCGVCLGCVRVVAHIFIDAVCSLIKQTPGLSNSSLCTFGFSALPRYEIVTRR